MRKLLCIEQSFAIGIFDQGYGLMFVCLLHLNLLILSSFLPTENTIMCKG